jgi:ABC-type nitrate/sulfonate/bicarbonate transport system substrate-binding protein
MTIFHAGMTRRQALATVGAGVAAASLGGLRPANAAYELIRQGYQTNMWGMPTYYLMHSGILEKLGLKFKEFPVPSGNLTMQQMVARQVDLGTYSGPSLIIGNARGGLVAIAQIEHVGKTIRVMGRKDLNLKTIEDLRGKMVANQVGSSVGNIFDFELMPKHGMKKSDWHEIRMNVNDMVSALVAKTVDAMVCVEPYNAIAEAKGIANTIVDYSGVDPLPVFMVSTPEFAEKNGDTLVQYLKGWMQAAKDFKDNYSHVSDVVYKFYGSKGYDMSAATFKDAFSRVEVNPVAPTVEKLGSYLEGHAKVLLKAKKIKKIPDFSKVLLPQYMKKAMA